MKKILTALCAAMLLLSLAACGGQDASAGAGGTGSVPAGASSAASVAQAPSSSETEEDEPYSPGTWTDNVYNDPWANISFTLPEGWLSLTGEEVELVVGELPETDTVSFCVTKSDLTGWVFMDVVDLEAAGSADLTEEQYVGQLQLVFKLTGEDSYDVTGPEDGEFAGIPCKTLTITDKNTGVVQTYYAAKKGARMLAFVTVASDAAVTGEVEALIASIQPAQAV